jgi:biotin synthase-like enzyme
LFYLIYTDSYLLFLDNNRIAKLNGRAFIGLNNLDRVWLRNNQCIRRDFNGEQATMANLIQNIPENCAFCEFDKLCLPVIDEKKETIESQIMENARLSDQLARVTAENEANIRRIRLLEERCMIPIKNDS